MKTLPHHYDYHYHKHFLSSTQDAMQIFGDGWSVFLEAGCPMWRTANSNQVLQNKGLTKITKLTTMTKIIKHSTNSDSF